MLWSLELSVAAPSRTKSEVPASLVVEASGPPSPPIPGGGGQVAVSKQSGAGRQFGRSVTTAMARKERLCVIWCVPRGTGRISPAPTPWHELSTSSSFARSLYIQSVPVRSSCAISTWSASRR